MISRLDSALNFNRTALNMHAHRQEVLASNIANADTPNYKARDIDFKSALQSQLGQSGGALAMATTSVRHLPVSGASGMNYSDFEGYRPELQSSVDGNTVNMDVERGEYAENSIRYEASLTFINGIFSGMRRAITGQGQ